MKKLNDAKLKTIDFSQDEILSKASLKAIMGGDIRCECGGVFVGWYPTLADCQRRCDRTPIGQETRD